MKHIYNNCESFDLANSIIQKSIDLSCNTLICGTFKQQLFNTIYSYSKQITSTFTDASQKFEQLMSDSKVTRIGNFLSWTRTIIEFGIVYGQTCLNLSRVCLTIVSHTTNMVDKCV